MRVSEYIERGFQGLLRAVVSVVEVLGVVLRRELCMRELELRCCRCGASGRAEVRERRRYVEINKQRVVTVGRALWLCVFAPVQLEVEKLCPPCATHPRPLSRALS